MTDSHLPRTTIRDHHQKLNRNNDKKIKQTDEHNKSEKRSKSENACSPRCKKKIGFDVTQTAYRSCLVHAGNKTRTKDKYRVVYTEQQKVELEKEFLFNQYITIQRKAELAGSIGLTDRQVKIWFQNRRAKERKCRRKHDGVTQLPNTGMGVASVAPAVVGGAKTVGNDTLRLCDQLQPQQF